MQVFISYADQMANSDEIFKFMHKNKVGLKVALFWVAWAFVAEKACGNYSLRVVKRNKELPLGQKPELPPKNGRKASMPDT